MGIECEPIEGPEPTHHCTPGRCDPCVKGFPGCGPPDAHCNSCYDIPSGHQRQCECEKCICMRQANADKECPQHVEGNKWQDLRKKSHDPEIQELRERLQSSVGVNSILHWCPDDEWLTCVDRRFRQGKFGYLGQAVVHPGAAQDCDYPKTLTHGVVSDDLTPAAKLILPPPKTWYEQLDQDLNESIYASNRFRPLGRVPDPFPNIGIHVDPDTTTFGIKSDKDITAGELVNPKKNRHQVEAEHNCCRQLYRMTHGNFNPGEQICRNYDSPFKRTNTYGDKTPHDIMGRRCKKVIGTWRSCQPDPPYVSKVYADHLDQRLPKLGLPQDRLCGGKIRGDSFVYGKRSEQERERPIREIIFNRCPNDGADKAMKIMSNLRDWLTKVRKNVRSDRGANLESFFEELQAIDTNCTGTVEWDQFISAMKVQKVPITMDHEPFMEALAYVNIFHPCPCNKLNYYLLMDHIKGYEDPKFHCKTTTLKPYYLPHTNSCIHFRTTYSDLTSNRCLHQSCIQVEKEQRVHGMPSVRTDRLPHKIRSTKDFTNYGDDGDAYSLIWPSVYTLRGVTCRDAFQEFTRDQMLKILCYAKVDISHEEFDCVWEIAQGMDPEKKSRVSYQAFREALCEKRARDNQITGFQPKVQITDCPPKEPIICLDKRKANPCAGVDP